MCVFFLYLALPLFSPFFALVSLVCRMCVCVIRSPAENRQRKFQSKKCAPIDACLSGSRTFFSLFSQSTSLSDAFSMSRSAISVRVNGSLRHGCQCVSTILRQQQKRLSLPPISDLWATRFGISVPGEENTESGSGAGCQSRALMDWKKGTGNSGVADSMVMSLW